MAEEIKEDVYWIGVDNPQGRDFHGVSTPRGGSYNSFLIVDDKPAIIDSTNKPFIKEYISSLKSKIDPLKVAYIIINHVEPDHTGAINQVLDECKNAKIVCTEKCKEFLISGYYIEREFVVVKENDEISLGKKTLAFYMDPMVHWPETMLTYAKEDKILFSGDLFGTEVAHEALFADEMRPFAELTRDYFAIVMRPFAPAVKSAIDKVNKLEMDFLCPSHGPVYRKDIDKIIGYYERLAVDPEEDKILIVYYSVWHSSQKIANQIAQSIIEQGFNVVMYNLADCNMIEVMAQAMTSKGVAFGSLTILGSYHPMFDALFGLLRFINQHQSKKPALVFGTYGWGSASVPKLRQKIEELNYNIVDEIDLHWGPKKDDLTAIHEKGKKLVEEVQKWK